MYRDIAVMACCLAGELVHDTMENLYRDMAGNGLGSSHDTIGLYSDRQQLGLEECVTIHSLYHDRLRAGLAGNCVAIHGLYRD